MAAALLPMRDHDPGFTTLAAQVATGAAVYAFVVLSADVAGMRNLAVARLRLTAARMKAL
jgi:hypothetical protein